MTAKTGEKCPVSGVWKVDGFPTTTAPIAKGNTMPPYCGKAVTWRAATDKYEHIPILHATAHTLMHHTTQGADTFTHIGSART